MNIRSMTYILGWILNIEAGFMLLPIGTAVVYGERQGWAFVLTAALCLLAGALLTRKKPRNPGFFMRDAFVTTALGWIVMSVMGCIPFVMTGEIPHFIDALFETVSGFTTTGASIMTDVEAMSHCSMVWRCFTHWIGGMGVLVFLLAVLPMVGGSSMNLMKAESPGPSVGKLVPKVRFTAQILYRLYIALTAAEFVLLLIGHMSPYEALCTAFGTAGTGGFGVKNSSIAGYSPYIQWVVTVFMIVFGVNFNVYFLLIMGKPGQAFRCEEMRWYLAVIAAATALIFVNAYDTLLTAENNLRNAAFQVASIITTTGYATADFNLWPEFSRTILVMLMFVGACAGSTGGGMKISRFVIAAKSLGAYLVSFLHPRAVRRIKFEEKDVEKETTRAVQIYFVAVAFIVAFSVLLLSLDGKDLVSTFAAVAATFNNIGPGLEAVGPTANYASFSALSKSVMIFDMLAGRLEVFPMLMLFYPGLWREAISESRRRRRLRRDTGRQ